MLSSYNIIKSTVVGSNEVVSPPIYEKIFQAETHKKKDNASYQNTDSLGGIYELITSEAHKAKEDIIKEAQAKALSIINEAIVEGERIKAKASDDGHQEGYQRGYEEGYNYGLNEANNEGEKIRNKALKTKENSDLYIKNCNEQIKIYIREREKDIIKLSTDIAKTIINTEITVNPDAVYKMAEKLISKAIDKKQIIIKVNPADFNIVKNRKDELSIYVEDSNSIIVVGDPELNRGCIIAETPSGFINGNINEQLDTILNSLIGE